MVDVHHVQDGGVQVADMRAVLDRGEAAFVGRTGHRAVEQLLGNIQNTEAASMLPFNQARIG